VSNVTWALPPFLIPIALTYSIVPAVHAGRRCLTCHRATSHQAAESRRPRPRCRNKRPAALTRRLLGPSWLAWQLASGAVLAEASWPLFLVLQLRQGDLTDKCVLSVVLPV
jgi:hypothetical protein